MRPRKQAQERIVEQKRVSVKFAKEVPARLVPDLYPALTSAVFGSKLDCMATRPEIEATYRPRVLVISDTSGFGTGQAGGPAWSLAEALSRDHDVVLAVPAITQASHRMFAVVYYNRRNIALLVRDSDIVIFGPSSLAEYPFLGESGPLLAAGADSFRSGEFEGRSLDLGPDANPNLSPGELLVLRPDHQVATGIQHYLGRLRFHLRQGGIRQATRQGGASVKRKFRGRKRN